MNKFKYLLGLINFDNFEIPKKDIKSKYLAFKYSYSKNIIDNQDPNIYLANRSSDLDQTLLANSFEYDYLYLKTSVSADIALNRLDKAKMKELMYDFEVLHEYCVSVVIFPEPKISVFGEVSEISPAMAKFLKSTNFNLKFLGLIGTYFAHPVWAKDPRRCNTSFKQLFSLANDKMKKMPDAELIFEINKRMPSSASLQSKHHNIGLYSKKLAVGLETVAYCCPFCFSLLSLYSEFNLLKCRNCGSGLELQPDGSILLSKHIRNLDELASFQFEKLSHIKPQKNHIVSFDRLYKCKFAGGKSFDIAATEVFVFDKKIILNQAQSQNEIKFSQIEFIELLQNNILKFTFKSQEEPLYLRGAENECIYIIHDFWKLSKLKK